MEPRNTRITRKNAVLRSFQYGLAFMPLRLIPCLLCIPWLKSERQWCFKLNHEIHETHEKRQGVVTGATGCFQCFCDSFRVFRVIRG